MIRLLTLVLLLNIVLFGQLYTEKDVEICSSVFSFSVEKELGDKPIGDVISEVGKKFLGTKYEAFACERDGEEQLVIHLTGLDCTTFLENALVFSRLIKSGKTNFEDYQNELTYVRYRDGRIDRYPSRLHYFSDWIFNNTSKGIVEDVTKEIGGDKIKFKVGFMSSNPGSYKHLKETPEFIPAIQKQEEDINSREYYYIPNKKVASAENQIRNGDLIAITTNLKGLDIGHVGIAVKMDNGRIHFMHAPLAGSEVQITKDPLPVYLSKIKKHTGIIVLRPAEPKI
jgi:hypothetical protein